MGIPHYTLLMVLIIFPPPFWHQITPKHVLFEFIEAACRQKSVRVSLQVAL